MLCTNKAYFRLSLFNVFLRISLEWGRWFISDRNVWAASVRNHQSAGIMKGPRVLHEYLCFDGISPYIFMFPGRDLVSVCLHDEGGGIYRHSVSFESYLERIFVWIVYCSVDARNCMYVLFEWGSIVNKQKCVWFPIYVDLEDEDVVLRANWIGICFSLKRWLNMNEIWLYLFLLCGKLYIIYV